MAQTAMGRKSAAELGASRDQYLRAFRWMLLARVLEDKLASLYRAGQIHGGVYRGKGQEALSSAIGVSLHRGDVFAPLIRDQAGRLAFGESLLDVVQTYLGSPKGPMRGRDGNVHRGRPKEGQLPMISHLGAMISVVNGILLARRFQGVKGTVGCASVGDGATSTGSFHEALNLAAIERLPLVLVVADNQYAYSTPTDRQFACRHLVDRAAGYGVEGLTVDGTDLGACLEVVGQAIRQARQGRGPQLVVATLLRLCGHGDHDDAGYVDPELKTSPVGRDCLQVAEQFLLERTWAEPGRLETWRREASQQIEEALAQAKADGSPDPYRADWCALSCRHLGELQAES